MLGCSQYEVLSEFYIALFSGGQDLEPDREMVICLGHGSILWSGSELSISKTRKPICGYLSVERQEVNKVVYVQILYSTMCISF